MANRYLSLQTAMTSMAFSVFARDVVAQRLCFFETEAELRVG